MRAHGVQTRQQRPRTRLRGRARPPFPLLPIVYQCGWAFASPLSCRERHTIDGAQTSGRRRTGVPVQTRLMHGLVRSGRGDYVTQPVRIYVHWRRLAGLNQSKQFREPSPERCSGRKESCRGREGPECDRSGRVWRITAHGSPLTEPQGDMKRRHGGKTHRSGEISTPTSSLCSSRPHHRWQSRSMAAASRRPRLTLRNAIRHRTSTVEPDESRLAAYSGSRVPPTLSPPSPRTTPTLASAAPRTASSRWRRRRRRTTLERPSRPAGSTKVR